MNDYQPHHERIRVRTNDLDAWNRLRASSLLSYLEQTAVAASAAAGFGERWYADQQTAWVIRHMRWQILGAAAAGDILTATTWISTFARVRAIRVYEVRQADGTPVAVAAGEWAYVDRVRMRPIAINPAITALFTPIDPSPLLAPWSALPPAPARPPHQLAHHARRYEADSIGHINNTIYADWLEEAAGDAVRAWGTPLATPPLAGLLLELRTGTITYLRSALPGDDIVVSTTCTGADPATRRLALTQEITRAPAAEVLVRAETIYQLSGAAPEAPAQ